MDVEKFVITKRLAVFLVLVAVFFYGGCGIVGVFGTDRRHERKVPAEYNLAEHKDQKVLVLVNQPAYLNAQANLRYHLTETINKKFMQKIKIPPEHLVGYSELSRFRSSRADFSLLSPAEVGTALDASMVLVVAIEDCQLREIAETGYYKASLNVRSVLVDTATGEQLWPESAGSKSIRVGFDIEQKGREAAIRRLAAAYAHCTVRYFYDCPRDKFKIAEDRSSIGWENWKKQD